MFNDNQPIAQIKNNLIFLSDEAISVLINAGVCRQVAESARYGLFIQDRGNRGEIEHSINEVLSNCVRWSLDD